MRIAHWIMQAGVYKTINMVIVELERILKRTRLVGKPYYYFIDPCSYCNLRCPLCATGAGTHQRLQRMLGLVDYGILLDKIAPFAVTVALHNWGEPLLNPEVFKMIRMTSDRKIQTVMSSNLNTEYERLGEEIVASGLSRLIVSLDGVTQEVYQKYRLGGDIELVFDNINKIITAKNSSGLETPVIEWQFLVFKHNEHEIPYAKELAERLRVDQFVCRPANFPYDHYSFINQARMEEEEVTWMPTDPKYWETHPGVFKRKGYLWKGACHYLYRGMSIAPDGSVSPCCYDYSNRQDFGNLKGDNLNELWNSPAYQRSRRLFAGSPATSSGTICEGCFLFQRVPVIRM